mmetsp:Transcript_1927/g.3861  ORF Transcript_1927/g.3861 Transcript_1927/m.3861 type:complete len:236 (-) Transcript_1927:88-795(-)|eukprot:CAMPEP_0118657288 /NCGR_PEP_ID=MMETSP0785-20121206/13940_1 /TAXON_ID=91992 /ORGANISM="Bolidomonas pacifica, Strain CCMP 1866" /LENGTH=235 /DNA_ID=CAMNT_0006550199 /DNA_START=59 /DNA_END=766 /DNA_ORIENTATION=-
MEDTVKCTPPESLLKYANPLYVGIEPKDVTTAKAPDGKVTQLDDMLDSMIPPRQWVEESGAWMQHVSKDPATRHDVITLQEQLDRRHLERQARETGLCPVREDLYTQAFDELIRQVTMNGPERGLLLLRVRDEIRMTVDAYKTLYDSSVTFGVKKQLAAEKGMSEMEAKIEGLEDKKKALTNKVMELRNTVDVIEKREAERRALEDKKRKEEIDFLKHQGQHLDQFLKQVGGSTK